MRVSDGGHRFYDADKQQAARNIQTVLWKAWKVSAALHICTVSPSKCSKLSPFQIGDRIVSICGTSAEGMSHSQAVALLKNATGTIQLQVSYKRLLSPPVFLPDKSADKLQLSLCRILPFISVQSVQLSTDETKGGGHRLWSTIKRPHPALPSCYQSLSGQ